MMVNTSSYQFLNPFLFVVCLIETKKFVHSLVVVRPRLLGLHLLHIRLFSKFMHDSYCISLADSQSHG